MTDKYDKDHSMPDRQTMPDRKTMLDIARRVSRLIDHRFISPMELVTDEYDGSESIEEWHRRRRGPEK